MNALRSLAVALSEDKSSHCSGSSEKKKKRIETSEKREDSVVSCSSTSCQCHFCFSALSPTSLFVSVLSLFLSLSLSPYTSVSLSLYLSPFYLNAIRDGSRRRRRSDGKRGREIRLQAQEELIEESLNQRTKQERE